MDSLTQTHSQPASGILTVLDSTHSHAFVKPIKMIHEGHDVSLFLTSQAYCDIGTFVMQLNIAMCPRKLPGSDAVQIWQLDEPVVLPEPVQKLHELLQSIGSIFEEAPPDTGPRRFGNVSFRKWYEILESRIQDLLMTHLPTSVLGFPVASTDGPSVLEELTPYLLGAFGSPQRLDYGTGHELSFLAFLGCIWMLGGFGKVEDQDGSLRRSIVIGVFEPYLRVVRRLILTYTLEPAGSHGVWGLDDHSFVSYIFGSSQYCPAITGNEAMPVEGALPGSPNPGDIAKKKVVDLERKHNMYFSAVGFINDVKTGPFWEHSPMLFDISGVRSGWGKINKGMIKMYNAEVLSKFPVVQHFPFGSLFSWDQNPNAVPVSSSAHISTQPNRPGSSVAPTTTQALAQESTQVPWATRSSGSDMGPTQAPWAQAPPSHRRVPPSTKAPWVSSTTSGEQSMEQPPHGAFDVPTEENRAKKDEYGGR